MFDGRKHPVIAALVAIVLATALGILAVANPANADPDDPDIATVKAKFDRLEHEAEAAAERANDARHHISESQTKLAALNADLAKQQAVVDGMRQQIASIVVDEYQAHALSTASQLVLSNNPDGFIDNLNAVSTYNDQRAVVLEGYTTHVRRLELRKSAVKDEVEGLKKLELSLAAEQAETEAKGAKVKELLDKLKQEELAKLLGASYDGPMPELPANERAATAIKYAMAQVGKSYVYGAAGPSAFDCSGLMMRAWGSAGVSLPHSSRAQSGMGTRIGRGDLQPGDLVFYYSPISHVAMYIGNGRIVHAANPGAGVRVSSLSEMPYSGAVRVG